MAFNLIKERQMTYDDHNGYRDELSFLPLDGVTLTKTQLRDLLALLDSRLAESGGVIDASQWASVLALAKRGLNGL